MLGAAAVCGTAAPEVCARKLRVTGNRHISRDAVRSLAQRSGFPGSAGSRDRLLRSVTGALLREGFLDVTVTLTHDETDSTWVLSLQEGRRARIGSVVLRGAKHIPEPRLRERLALLPGSAFRPVEFTRRVDEVLRRYDAEGYPFAQIWVDSTGYEPETRLVGLVLSVVEGNPRVLAGASFEGLTRTRESVARRLAGVAVGQRYSARVLEDAWLRLRAVGVFDAVDPPDVQLAPDGRRVVAVLRVKEPEKANRFAAAIGYAASEGTGSSRVINGLAHLDLVNIGGTLKDFEVLWNDDGRSRRQTRVHFRDRFFAGHGLAFGIRIEQLGQDTVYTWQSGGIDVSRTAGRFGGGLVTAGVSAFADRNIFSSGTLVRTWRYRGVVNGRWIRGSPRAGGFFDARSRVTVARKHQTFASDSTASLTQWILELEADASVSLSRNVALRIRPVLRSLQTAEDAVPLSEQFYVGGARTLRGYRENQFHGRRIATLSTEFLVGPDRSQNAYLFADAGYVHERTPRPGGGTRVDDAFPVGAGFGFRTRSAVGNIDLSFGVGDRLSLEQTKVHVVLVQRF